MSKCFACENAPAVIPKERPVFCEECNAKCSHCGGDNDVYPWYGCAPHAHVGESMIGSTVILLRDDWPKNFVEEPGCKGMGWYWCPVCENGKNEALDILKMAKQATKGDEH